MSTTTATRAPYRIGQLVNVMHYATGAGTCLLMYLPVTAIRRHTDGIRWTVTVTVEGEPFERNVSPNGYSDFLSAVDLTGDAIRDAFTLAVCRRNAGRGYKNDTLTQRRMLTCFRRTLAACDTDVQRHTLRRVFAAEYRRVMTFDAA